MAIEDSILKGTKKILGLDEAYTEFDFDVITHVNTCFVRLKQLGIGPTGGFMIESDQEKWQDFTQGELDLNSVKTFVYLKVRLVFDPPGLSHHITAIKDQITELEHCLLTERNLSHHGADTFLPGFGSAIPEVVLDGGSASG